MKVEPVVERDVPISVEYVGTLVGAINAQIRSRVGGHLISQHDKEGFVHATVRYRHRLASDYEVLEAQQELYPVIARGIWRDDKCGA